MQRTLLQDQDDMKEQITEIIEKWKRKTQSARKSKAFFSLSYGECEELIQDLEVLAELFDKIPFGEQKAKFVRRSEAELFVDEYIEANGCPPTYKEVGEHFGITKQAAYLRLKNYRHKMVRYGRGE